MMVLLPQVFKTKFPQTEQVLCVGLQAHGDTPRHTTCQCTMIVNARFSTLYCMCCGIHVVVVYVLYINCFNKISEA